MCKKIDASVNQAIDGIAALGNLNHWSGWLAFLEAEIERRVEAGRPLTDATCYVSWLLLSSECIAYRLRWHFYADGNFENAQVFDDQYRILLDKCATVMPAELFEHVQFAVKVRHILVHKGFPNPQKAPTQRSRNLCRGTTFSEADVREIRNQIKLPANYEKVKSRFHAVRSWLEDATPNVTFEI